MSRKYEICGKGPLVGNSVSRSSRMIKRCYLPNLCRAKAVVKEEKRLANVCIEFFVIISEQGNLYVDADILPYYE